MIFCILSSKLSFLRFSSEQRPLTDVFKSSKIFSNILKIYIYLLLFDWSFMLILKFILLINIYAFYYYYCHYYYYYYLNNK